jgi:hypothetical protein
MEKNIYLINVADNILKLMKIGVERFYEHEYNYDINFLSYRILQFLWKSYSFIIRNLIFNYMYTIKCQSIYWNKYYLTEFTTYMKTTLD